MLPAEARKIGVSDRVFLEGGVAVCLSDKGALRWAGLEFKRQLAGLPLTFCSAGAGNAFAVDPFGDFYRGRTKSHKEFDCESTPLSLLLPPTFGLFF